MNVSRKSEGRTNEQRDGQRDGQMDGWMDRWIDGRINAYNQWWVYDQQLYCDIYIILKPCIQFEFLV